MANSKTHVNSSKRGTLKAALETPEGGNPLLKDMFSGNVNVIQARTNRDRLQTANFYGGLPSESFKTLRNDPAKFDRFRDYSSRRNVKKRAVTPDYNLRYNAEVDQPFRVPLGFSVPDAINRTSIGAPQTAPQTQLPEFGFGSWLNDNSQDILGTAGALAGAIPVIGPIAGPVLSGIGSLIGNKKAAAADQTLLDDEAASQKKQQAGLDRQTRISNVVDRNQVNYGATFENGGQIGEGFTGQPQITEYTNGEKHGESAVGGIPVDARGNPATTSKQSAVGLTEKGEVTWNGYVFSDKLKS